MEFAQLISKRKKLEDEVKLHLVTNNNEDYIENARESFRQMAEVFDSLEFSSPMKLMKTFMIAQSI